MTLVLHPEVTAEELGLTADEFYRLENDPSVEYVGGVLIDYDKPPGRQMSWKSSVIGSQIHGLMFIVANETGEARVIGSDLGYQCFPFAPKMVRKPDVSVIRGDRASEIDGDPGLCPIPADLVVEVVSPNDLAYDVDRKVDEYLSADFPLVWVVNPVTRTVLIYRGDGSTARLGEDDEITGEAALPAFRCRVGEFFA